MKLTVEDIKNISSIKEEPEWMLEFRLNAFKYFLQSEEPNFGPKLNIDYDAINYYKRREEQFNVRTRSFVKEDSWRG